MINLLEFLHLVMFVNCATSKDTLFKNARTVVAIHLDDIVNLTIIMEPHHPVTFVTSVKCLATGFRNAQTRTATIRVVVAVVCLSITELGRMFLCNLHARLCVVC